MSGSCSDVGIDQIVFDTLPMIASGGKVYYRTTVRDLLTGHVLGHHLRPRAPQDAGRFVTAEAMFRTVGGGYRLASVRLADEVARMDPRLARISSLCDRASGRLQDCGQRGGEFPW